MRRIFGILTGVLCTIVLVAGVAMASYSYGAQQGGSGPVGLPTPDGSAEHSELGSTVDELYDHLLEHAVEAPDGDILIRAALEAMLEELDDPYAVYYDAGEYASFNEMLDGSLSGVGMALEEAPDGVTVVTVFPDTPADEAGVEVGEIIVSVDGDDVADMPVDAVAERVRGDEGTDVTLGLAGGDEGDRELTLTRAEITIPSVETTMLDSGAGHVQLYNFTSNAGEQIEAEVTELLDEGANGIILDLRSNPGGLLDQAVDVTSVFLDADEVVRVQEADEDMRVLRATTGGFTDVPLVVLVDEASASASEIVAGAIQDADRGRIVGTHTFGKGTVQTVRSLADGSGAKFTTAKYFTPSGDSIEGTGVEPDVETGADPDEQLTAAEAELDAIVAQVAR